VIAKLNHAYTETLWIKQKNKEEENASY